MNDAPIRFEVTQVENGWMLRELDSARFRGNQCRTWVFTTIAGMTSWMTQNLKEPTHDRQD